MASVEPTSYPNGPPGYAVRLERSERGQIARSLARWTVPIGLVLAGLGVVFATRTTHPALFAVLAALCVGLAGLSLLSPAIYAWNERLTVYYIDSGWIAEYRGRRRDYVELGTVTEITPTALRNLSLIGDRRQLLVPVAAVRPAEIARCIRQGLARAGEQHAVHIEASVRAMLQDAGPPNHELVDRLDICPPPLDVWDAVRQNGARPAHKRGG